MPAQNFATLLIGHYPNDELASMERFDACLNRHLFNTGGKHQAWNPPLFLGRLFRSSRGIGKWLGYFDKFILFPIIIRFRLSVSVFRSYPTLVILSDHSHGIYAPLFRKFDCVVHVHDMIAIRMAANRCHGQTLGRSGRIYQNLIAEGLKNSENFICISKASQADLLEFVSPEPQVCEVVYNELNYPYQPAAFDPLPLQEIQQKFSLLEWPFLLHVGNNLWYKNRRGVLEIFRYCVADQLEGKNLQLVIVGDPASQSDLDFVSKHGIGSKVLFLQGINNPVLEQLYSMAVGLIFPSHHEGFGWPIAEAFACGCPVLTCRRAPMTEVGGDHADYVEPMPSEDDRQAMESWLASARTIVVKWMSMDPEARKHASLARVTYSQRFAVGQSFKRYHEIYTSIMSRTNSTRAAS